MVDERITRTPFYDLAILMLAALVRFQNFVIHRISFRYWKNWEEKEVWKPFPPGLLINGPYFKRIRKDSLSYLIWMSSPTERHLSQQAGSVEEAILPSIVHRLVTPYRYLPFAFYRYTFNYVWCVSLKDNGTAVAIPSSQCQLDIVIYLPQALLLDTLRFAGRN